MRLSEVRINSEYLLITLNRRIELTEFFESTTEIIKRLSIVRLNSECLLKTLNGSIQLTKIIKGITRLLCASA